MRQILVERGALAPAILACLALATTASGQSVLATAAADLGPLEADVASWLADGAMTSINLQPDPGPPSFGQGGNLGLTVGAVSWFPMLSGDLSLEDAFGVATGLDVDDDLGLGELGADGILDVRLRQGPHQVTISGFALSASDVEQALNSIVFGDLTINPGDFFDSEIDLENIKFQYSYLLFTAAEHGFDFGLSTGIDYFHLDAALEDVVSSVRESFEEHLPIPIAGVQVGVPLGPISVHADVSGFYIEIEDVKAGFMDATVTLAWEPVPNVSIYGGYRILAPDLNGSDFQFDTELHGAFIGGAFSF